jgi:hypothetical protein
MWCARARPPNHYAHRKKLKEKKLAKPPCNMLLLVPFFLATLTHDFKKQFLNFRAGLR